MNDNSENPMDAWVKSMGDFWTTMAQGWTQTMSAKPEADIDARMYTAFSNGLKNWQTTAGVMSSPDGLDALLKGAGAMPDILLQITRAALDGVLEMQQKVMENAGRMGETVEAYRFKDIDENLFRAWSDIYEKEFKKFFYLPQLGLFRGYQEKIGLAADKYHQFQVQVSEFIRILGLPFNRSLQVMQAKVAEMADAGELPDDPQAYYELWVKVLEGHFMTLFQTPEYGQTMGKAINALAELAVAKNAVLEDMISVLPVARQTEMDDLAQEVYRLKKRVRALEKQIA